MHAALPRPLRAARPASKRLHLSPAHRGRRGPLRRRLYARLAERDEAAVARAP